MFIIRGGCTIKRLILTDNNEYISNINEKKGIKGATWNFYRKFIPIVIKSRWKVTQKTYNDENWVISSLDVMGALENAGVKFQISGLENLKMFEGPAVFVSNHMGNLETMILPAILHPLKPISFVIKKELVNFPVFGKIAAARDPILVDRKNPREDLRRVMQQGSDKVREGKSIVIFPQKTREPRFDEHSFNSLGVKLARSNDIPVVPIALLSDAWANGTLFKDFGRIDPARKVYFALGSPIDISGNGSEQHKAVIDFIKSKLISWDRSDLLVPTKLP